MKDIAEFSESELWIMTGMLLAADKLEDLYYFRREMDEIEGSKTWEGALLAHNEVVELIKEIREGNIDVIDLWRRSQQ